MKKARQGRRRQKSEARKKELRNRLFRINSVELARCYANDGRCKRPAIRAHSVQNARVLQLLVRKGHVIGFTRRLDAKTGPEIEFGSIGRNRATTFTGLCAQHDTSIFGPLDREVFDASNPQHLFLVAYRATLREFHAAVAAAWKLQVSYLQRVDLGFDPKNAPSHAGLFATDRYIRAYETFQYKAEFDAAYSAGRYKALVHDVMHLDVAQPTVAACALFSHYGVMQNGEEVRVSLNVLPVSQTHTVAVCSYLLRDARLGRALMDRALATTGAEQKYELSRRLLNYCENFVLAPAYFDTWSPRKRQVVRDYYVSTVLEDNLTVDEPDLILF